MRNEKLTRLVGKMIGELSLLSTKKVNVEEVLIENLNICQEIFSDEEMEDIIAMAAATRIKYEMDKGRGDEAIKVFKEAFGID